MPLLALAGLLLALFASAAAAVPTRGRLVESRRDLISATVGGVTRYALAGPRHRFAVRVDPSAVLTTAFGVDADAAGAAAGREVEFVVSFVRDGKREVLFRRREGGMSVVAWSDIRFTVRPRRAPEEAQGEIAGELWLEAYATRGAVPGESIHWTPPHIGPVPREDGPNLILLSIDTLRADHLGCYGYDRDTSPNLDALADDGVLFENAISSSNWTLPAHASMLTGLNPSRHGAVRPGGCCPVPAELETVAELLWDRGYTTGAFTGDGLLRPGLGFAQGFDHFEEELDAADGATGFAAKVGRALAWMESVRSQRFFLFLHTYSVHMPYQPRPPYDVKYDPEYQGPYAKSFESADVKSTDVGRTLTARQVDHLEALYDGGIAEMDATVGDLVTGLRNQGLMRVTCIAVTSDHGEEFHEHGGLLHGSIGLFDELLRVPLIVWCPEGVTKARRVEGVVSTVDIAPTLLDLGGAEISGDLDGISLVPLLRSAAPVIAPTPLRLDVGSISLVARPDEEAFSPREMTISEVDAGVQWVEGSVAAVRTRRYKLVEKQPGNERALYDLLTDPGETKDLSREQPRIVKQLLKRLRAERRPAGAAATGGEAVPEPTLDQATVERLRALGYME